MFCGCSTAFGAPPNTQTCPVCLGHAGRAAGAEPPRRRVRGPDRRWRSDCQIDARVPLRAQELLLPGPAQGLPDQPVRPAAGRGRLARDRAPSRRTRAHRHPAAPPGGGHRQDHPRGRLRDRAARAWSTSTARACRCWRSCREPDLRSPEEAARVPAALARGAASTSGSATATWRKARCAATPTSRCGRAGPTELGTKVEIKNMNSFRNVQHALEYEVERQARGARRRASGSCRRRGCGTPTAATRAPMRSQGVGARLPLLPRARPAAAACSTPAWVERGRARACPSCRRRRRQRFVRAVRAAGLRRRGPHAAQRARRLLRGGGARASRTPRPSPTGSWPSCCASCEGDDERAVAALADRAGAPGRAGRAHRRRHHQRQDRQGRLRADAAPAASDRPRSSRREGLTQVADAGALEALVDQAIAANPKAVADFKGGKTAPPSRWWARS